MLVKEIKLFNIVISSPNMFPMEMSISAEKNIPMYNLGFAFFSPSLLHLISLNTRPFSSKVQIAHSTIDLIVKINITAKMHYHLN